MAHPYPQLEMKPLSGLSFPWAEVVGKTESVSDASLGVDGGVTQSMVIMILWGDLEDAIQELLGYSWRDVGSGTPTLRRVLPWQHPYFNQLWVKRINSVKGGRLEGTNEFAPSTDSNVHGLNAEGFNPSLGSVGPGVPLNAGPWTDYSLAFLTLQFWRPPYFIRSDEDILDDDGNPQEWLRYLDKNWQIDTQMLTREGTTFVFESANSSVQGKQFQGSVGQKITKLKVKRKWYQIPEAAIFSTIGDGTPNGIPTNLIYTQTETTNPLTGYVYPVGSPIQGCVNYPVGGGAGTISTTTTSTSTTATMADTSLISVGDLVSGTGIPSGTAVASITNGTTFELSKAATATGTNTLTYFSDSLPSYRFLGCKTGTLLIEGIELLPVDLQLPPYLMQIPSIANNEALSQVQYDVVFHFELFDPPLAPDEYLGGHNTAPFSGNGLWYPIRSQAGTAPVSRSAGLTTSSTTITMANTSGISVGDPISGLGIPNGTTVVTVNTNTSLVLSQAVTKTGTFTAFVAAGQKTTPFQFANFEDLFVIS